MKTIVVDGQYLVDTGDVLSFKNQSAFFLKSGDPAEVVNGGTVSVKLTTSTSFSALHLDFPASAAFTNLEGARFIMTSTDQSASAIGFDMQSDHNSWSNNGVVQVSAYYDAIGVFGGHMDFDNQNELSVTGILNAGGVSIERSGSFSNSGQITVSSGAEGVIGAAATGVDIESLGEGRISFQNSGNIHVTSDGENTLGVFYGGDSTFENSGSIISDPFGGEGVTTALELGATSGSSHKLQIHNAGLIQGGFAIRESASEDSAATIIKNDGQLVGDVSLAANADRLVNHGSIQGSVDMGGGDDVFQGAAGSVTGVVDGGEGDDILVGGRGSDSLVGGAGKDAIDGGKGADVLTGGAGADSFAFSDINESRTVRPDLITDLHSADRIDLSAIDADITHAGDQAFVLVEQLDGHAGQAALSYDAESGVTTLDLDVDGDGQADGAIRLAGDHTDFSNFIF